MKSLPLSLFDRTLGGDSSGRRRMPIACQTELAVIADPEDISTAGCYTQIGWEVLETGTIRVKPRIVGDRKDRSALRL
jgi:hypothetical protein